MAGLKYWRFERSFCLIFGAFLGVLSTLSTPQNAVANDSVSALIVPSFLALELDEPASLLDRALLGAYQLKVRDPQDADVVLRDNLKQKLQVSDEQLQAAAAFFPIAKSIEPDWTPSKLNAATTILNFKFGDLRRIRNFDLAVETSFQLRKIAGAGNIQLNLFIATLPALGGPASLDALAKLNAMTRGMDANLKASDRLIRELLVTAETYPKNARNIINVAAQYLEPRAQAYFLIFILKAAILRSHVEDGTYELRANRLKVIEEAVHLLQPLMTQDNRSAGFLLTVLQDLRMTLDIDYFQILQPFFEQLKEAAGPSGLAGLLQLTSGSLEKFRMAGNFDDARLLFNASETMKSYLERYRLDMSLRALELRSRQAAEDLKTILRGPGLENYEIAFQEPLMFEILSYVGTQDLLPVLNTFMLRNVVGEVVGLPFVRAFSKKFDQVPNAQVEGVLSAVVSNSLTPATSQQVNLLIELKKGRREKSVMLDLAVARKLSRKVILGVFLAGGELYDAFTAPHLSELQQLIESYREAVSGKEFLGFIDDVLAQINKENIRSVNLNESLLYQLIKRYQQAGARVSTGAVTASSPAVCNRLLYKDFADIQRPGEPVEAEIIPFTRAR